MQSSIYLTLALVAFTSAIKLNVGPQTFSEPGQLSSSTQKPQKRYITQEYTLYLTPDQIKSLEAVENSEKSELPKESEKYQQKVEEQQQKWYTQYLPEAPQLDIQGLAAQNAFYQEQKANAETQQRNYQFINLYSDKKAKEEQKPVQRFPELTQTQKAYDAWQKAQEEKIQQENDSKWKSYSSVNIKSQEELLNEQLNKQLQQQWNLILENNRQKLKSLSSGPKEAQDSQKKQNEKTSEKAQKFSKSELAKEIESILKSYVGFELVKQNPDSQAEAFKQSLPILIQNEVSVTKHHPVPIIKKVNVPVATPVLVPVPEPYEVKIPHPYPVPFRIVKHVPIPVLRAH